MVKLCNASVNNIPAGTTGMVKENCKKEKKKQQQWKTREKLCSPVNSDRLSHVQQPTTALCGTDQVSRCRLMSNCELIFCYMSGSKGKTHLGCWLTHRNRTIQKKTETRLENTERKTSQKEAEAENTRRKEL
jgi:hypothetical protein